MRLCRSALLAAALVLGAPAAAQASSASVTSNVLSYAADNGEVNNVNLTLAGSYTLTDSGATITPGPGCSTVTANSVTCTATSAQIDVRDQGDIVTLGTVA